MQYWVKCILGGGKLHILSPITMHPGGKPGPKAKRRPLPEHWIQNGTWGNCV